MHSPLIRPIIVSAIATTCLAACASAPEPADSQIVRAETSIENAADSGAPEYAAMTLEDAREKLVAARLAAENGDDEKAMRLASEAEVDARLAMARAEQAEAEESLEEVRAGIDTLRDELEQSNYGDQSGYREGGTQ